VAPEENIGNCPHQSKIKAFFLNIMILKKNMLVDVSQAVCAASLCALMQVLLPPVGRGITNPCFGDGWACLRFGVTFEHRQVLPWAWQVVKGEGMSVNEAVYTGVIESTVGLDGRRRWCKVDMVAVGWCCSTPKGNEVSSCVGGMAARPRRNCVCFGLEEAVLFK
jgi:hypothetical protein